MYHFSAAGCILRLFEVANGACHCVVPNQGPSHGARKNCYAVASLRTTFTQLPVYNEAFLAIQLTATIIIKFSLADVPEQTLFQSLCNGSGPPMLFVNNNNLEIERDCNWLENVVWDLSTLKDDAYINPKSDGTVNQPRLI